MPILYSFRRCPYAMRARLAVNASGNQVELREVVLRDKPQSMLDASPKATVPVLVNSDGTVIEESLDIIKWSLENAMPETEASYWVEQLLGRKSDIFSLIEENDGSFKAALDAYKYPNKFPETDRENSWALGGQFIEKLDAMLEENSYLTGEKFSVADVAILPFIRQFAHVDQDRFYAQDWPNVIEWLDAFKASERFAAIMAKYKKWKVDDDVVMFGG